MENLRKNREPQPKPTPWFGALFLVIFTAGACSLLTPHPYDFLSECIAAVFPPEPNVAPQLPQVEETLVEEEAPEPEPVPPTPEEIAAQTLEEPQPWSPESRLRMSSFRLPNFPPALLETVGAQYESHINRMLVESGALRETNFVAGTIASQDRTLTEAYRVSVSVNALLPSAAKGAELKASNAELPQVLPGYEALMESAVVSPWFHSLYLHKQNLVRKAAAMVEKMPDKNSFLDTDTILELSAPESRRSVLWIQSDMKQAEPLPAPAEEQGTPLACERDSYIVLPAVLAERRAGENEKEGSAWRPAVGDYVAVVVGKRVFPAVVGGSVARFETGMASQRLCQSVKADASASTPAVTELGVSYIIFPGTAEGATIDYTRLNTRVRELLGEIGGLGNEVEFVEMQSLEQPQEPAAEM